MSIVVTGFGAFRQHDHNPSTLIAHAMASRDARFVAEAPLPVEFGAAAEVALRAAREARATAIVAIGLRASSPRVCVERRAQNACTTSEPDTAGKMRFGKAIAEGGATTLSTRLEVERVVDALLKAGVDAVASDDAGGYVCNDLYYRLLDAAARGAGPKDVLFVHVPFGADELTALPGALCEGVLGALGR